jgi:hypothetical protein
MPSQRFKQRRLHGALQASTGEPQDSDPMLLEFLPGLPSSEQPAARVAVATIEALADSHAGRDWITTLASGFSASRAAMPMSNATAVAIRVYSLVIYPVLLDGGLMAAILAFLSLFGFPRG